MSKRTGGSTMKPYKRRRRKKRKGTCPAVGDNHLWGTKTRLTQGQAGGYIEKQCLVRRRQDGGLWTECTTLSRGARLRGHWGRPIDMSRRLLCVKSISCCTRHVWEPSEPAWVRGRAGLLAVASGFDPTQMSRSHVQSRVALGTGQRQHWTRCCSGTK